MNLILTDIRNRLTVEHTSDLLFIALVGPPVNVFNPEPYIERWLVKHRDADDTRSRSAKLDKDSTRYEQLWPML